MQLNENTITSDLLVKWGEEFNTMIIDRLEMGSREYGDYGFIENDIWEYAKEEVVDLANYARFLYFKISALEMAVKEAE